MRPFNTVPRPDFAVRAAGPAWKHFPENLRPVLFSADAKLETRDRDPAQIAMNSTGTLILFILMYLDTRIKPEGRISGECWIPALIYHKWGFTAYAHYPKLVLEEDGNWSWRFVSRVLTKAFDSAWVENEEEESSLRMRGLNALTIFRAHASLAAKSLLEWTRNNRSVDDTPGAGTSPEGRQVLDQLIARAHWEAGDYEWVFKKAKEVSETASEAEN